MGRTIIVSNRLPISVQQNKDDIHFTQSVGGVATGLSSIFREDKRNIWVGWIDLPANKLDKTQKKDMENELQKQMHLYPVYLTKNDVTKYYYGFCNKTIWPLFHCFTQYPVYDKSLWESYKHVNQVYANELLSIIKPNDTVWIHDYHLMLLPKLLREKMPDLKIGFFLHIPFPPIDIFQVLPWRTEILEGIIAADLIGFHTYEYARYFLNSVSKILGYNHKLGLITAGDHLAKVDSFPMGIDYDKFADSSRSAEVKRRVALIRQKEKNRQVILSIDRLDYTKGIPQRLEAFDEFLIKYPEFKGKVSFYLIAVPSRTEVEHYNSLKRQVDELLGKINGKYSTLDWNPITYMYRSLQFEDLIAFYSIAAAAMVTPLKDGMNLIAKEFIASKPDGKGMLILSEMAGAANELGEVVMVNPNNREAMVEALHTALTMPEEEQVSRNRIMQRRLRRYDLKKWYTDFMDNLEDVKKLQKDYLSKKISPGSSDKIIANYQHASSRLIVLDYDGTLFPLTSTPHNPQNDAELMALLTKLTSDPKNHVLLAAGRDRETMQSWFGDFHLGLIAEHGAWVKNFSKDWKPVEKVHVDWKEQIKPILEQFVDKTPGSFVEDKYFSLAWHYRKVSPELASVRIRQLKDVLQDMSTHLKLNLGVFEVTKVIEIKQTSINKGQAILGYLRDHKWDFILAIGDDWTDEDLFGVLPTKAVTIKIGIEPSIAKYSLDSVTMTRQFLQDLIQ